MNVLISMLALMALVLGLTGVGLVRAQEATPVAFDISTAVPTATAQSGDDTASGAAPTPTSTPPPASPSPRKVTSELTTAGVQSNLSVVPNLTATNFGPVSSTFSQGYSSVNTTATINLTAGGDVADISDWQITLQGDALHPLVSPTDTGFIYMDFSVLSFQGLNAPVPGVTAANTGQSVSNNPSTSFLIAHGGNNGFTAGDPNQLSFTIVLGIAPTWANPPGSYSGNLVLTISGAPPTAP